MPKPKRAETLDTAARHLVYKLFDRTEGLSGAWYALTSIEERPATVARAVERGRVLTRDVEMAERLVSAMLTTEGRLVARRGR
jgi:hypothetical protein